jgi:hypothetical protein
MTGAPDSDVERALAAIGATPLKYYSFGVVAVRPPEAEANFPFGAVQNTTLPPSGEGTAQRYRSHAVAAVFPLLGLALPEAFHIDVEPIWPVGPPVSEGAVMLDQSADLLAPFAGLGNRASTSSASQPYSDIFAPAAVSAAPPSYESPPTGWADPPAKFVPFVMPAWLDPNRARDADHAPPEPERQRPWLDDVPPPTPPVAPAAAAALAPQPAVSTPLFEDGPPAPTAMFSPFLRNDMHEQAGSLPPPSAASPAMPSWMTEHLPPIISPTVSEEHESLPDWTLPILYDAPQTAETEPPPMNFASHNAEFTPLPLLQSHEPPLGHEPTANPIASVPEPAPAAPIPPEPISHESLGHEPLPDEPMELAPTWHDASDVPHMTPTSATHAPAAEWVGPSTAGTSFTWNATENERTPTNDSVGGGSPPIFSALVAEPPKSPAARTNRPLADLFRTLGAANDTKRGAE